MTEHDPLVPSHTLGTPQAPVQSFLRRTLVASGTPLLWLTPAYVVDWGLVAAGNIVARFYLYPMRPLQRDESLYLGDWELQWPHTEHERVPTLMLMKLSYHLPLVLLIVLPLLSHIHRPNAQLLPLLHHSILTLFTSQTIVLLTINTLKPLIGRLRPDFFARCQYSEVLGRCTGLQAVVDEGRRSFPSGHSGIAWSGLGVLGLWVAGRNGGLALGGDGRRGSGPGQSRLLRLALVLIWFGLAGWIAVTRLEDHMHHPTDVLIGSLLGISSALVSYHIYFPTPFDGRILGTTMGQPRLVYKLEVPEEDEAEGILREAEEGGASSPRASNGKARAVDH